MRWTTSLLAAILFACQAHSRQDDPEELKRRIQSLNDEVNRLRSELIRARLDVMELRLKEARRTGQAKEEMRILLEDGLDSEFVELKRHAFRALSAFPPERRKEAVAPVLERWKKGGDKFKVEALPFLGQFPEDAQATEAVLGATRDESPEVRRVSAVVLKTVSSDAALKALIALLQDPRREVRLTAVDALAVPKRDAAVEALTRFVKSERENELVEKGVDALGIIGNASALPTLLELLEHGPENVQWSCINSLGKIGDPRATEKVRPFLDEKRSRQLREVAVASLGKLKDQASLPAFENFLRKDPDPQLRIYAAGAILRVGDASAAERCLLPAYCDEKEEPVRKAVWEALIGLADAHFDILERVTGLLLDKNMRAEVEELSARIHEIKPGDDIRARYVALEERVAKSSFDAKAWREALGHYKNLVKHSPDHWEGHRMIARCDLELGDAEAALRTLQEQAARLPKGEKTWWEFKKDTFAVLAKLDDPARTLDESQPLVNSNPMTPPEDLRKTIETAHAAAAAILIQRLGSSDEKTRKAATEAAKKLGKKVILILAAAVENADVKASYPAAIDAANSITQTSVDPALADPVKLKEAAGAWRAWYEKNK